MTFSYQNPVYPHNFADPFILQTESAYFAYGTAETGSDGRPFPVLTSTDLTHWQPLGGALEPLQNPAGFSYWAPEVASHNGQFHLFYSASTSHSDEHHRLRVAVSSVPQGPFRDSGKLLLPEVGFSIDASPFRDPATGQWYLYFATDFEFDEPHGTGLAVVPLAPDLLSVTAAPTSVVRAQADWQIYERNRQYKGQHWPKWHCVEGPSVIHHEGRYYCFYSGGAWHGDSYGVGYAIADHPLGPWHDRYGRFGPSVLKGIPGEVIGPGHNSITRTPDRKTLLMVYHAWDRSHTARRMCIDPIRWTADGPKVDGPTSTIQQL